MYHFKCLKLAIHAETQDMIFLPPFKGAIFRSAFGNAFRKTVCVARSKTCPTCFLNTQCIYSYAFESPIQEQSTICKNYSHAPHPFILNPPLEQKTCYEPGDCVDFELTLVGGIIDSLPYFIYTIIRMGELGLGKTRGKFKIIDVKAVNAYDHHVETVYANETLMPIKTILTFDHAQEKAQRIASDQIGLNWLTPLRIQHDGRLCDDPGFELIMKNCFRRITSLLYFHCNDNAPPYHDDAIKQAVFIQKIQSNTQWQTWTRYSSRQQNTHNVGGLIGEMTFQGDLIDYIPYLELCSWINLGKGTAFGLGKFQLMTYE